MPDLHGCEGLVFPNWDESCSYLEAVNYTTEAEAIAQFQEECCDYGTTPALTKVWFRYLDGDEATQWVKETHGEHGHPIEEFLCGWVACQEDHPDAVPFWSDEE